MSHAEPLDSSQPEEPPETFSVYLAKQFIAKKGFDVAQVPEVELLRGACDIVLTRSDGYTFLILCIVDREARPDAVFDVGVEDLKQIGTSALRYAGKVSGSQMPVSILIVEVGPGAADQPSRLATYKRSSWRSKVLPYAMTVDTISGTVWHSGSKWFLKGAYRGFVENLLAAPREEVDLTALAVATAPPSFPIVTAALIATLAAVFAVEITYGIGPWTNLLQPTITTLVAFGGVTRSLVVQSGEWYRLLAAPFLHADAGHLLMNSVGLFLAGRALEQIVGRAWFGAIYVIGGLTGSLLSLALIPPSIVSVGASGAIMGLFAAMLVVSRHFPPGATRVRLQLNSLYVLIASLLPLSGALNGQKVDYAAHFGGAICGALLGLLIIRVWSRTEPLPKLRHAAGLIAIVGVVALAYPTIAVLQGYPAMAFTTQLIPNDKVPKSFAEMRARAAELVKQYPNDPRPRFVTGADLFDANDLAGAEREARAGLAFEHQWSLILQPQIAASLRVVLALAIDKDRHDEAVRAAGPACAVIKDGPMRKLLDDRKLCAT